MTHLIMDSHVHYYPCFKVADLLDAACRNLLGDRSPEQTIPAIVWTRFPAESDLRKDAESLQQGWQADPVDPFGMWLQHPQKGRIFVYFGSQLVTAEKLELLVVGAYRPDLSGQPLQKLIDQLAPDYLLILPWGVGKWLGARGKAVQEVIAGRSSHNLVLGDNSARPGFWPMGQNTTTTNAAKCPILPGTDPLPIPGQESRVGKSSFCLNLEDSEVPSPSRLGELLQSAWQNGELSSSDRRENPLRFLTNQLRIRLP